MPWSTLEHAGTCARLGMGLQVLTWLSNVVSRRFEFQADGFGVALGRGEQLREALIILDKENKASWSASGCEGRQQKLAWSGLMLMPRRQRGW